MKLYQVIFLTGFLFLTVCALGATPVYAQTPTPPSPTATRTPLTEYEGPIVNTILDVIGEVVKYILIGLIVIFVSLLFKANYQEWMRRGQIHVQQRDAVYENRRKRAALRKKNNKKYLKTYFKQMENECGYVHLKSYPYPIPMGDIFTERDVFTPPNAMRQVDIRHLSTGLIRGQTEHLLTDYIYRHAPEILFARLRERNRRISGGKFLINPQNKRLLILGKPGVGKTIFLHYLVHQATIGELDKIPILVNLGGWMKSEQRKNLLAYIVHQFEIHNFPNARHYIEGLLEMTDKALVLFDGLDEVSQIAEDWKHVVDTLHEFALQYERAYVFITCRTIYVFQKFTSIEIADFTDDQVYTYVNKWFRDSPAEKDLFFKELKKSEYWNLRELARWPLFLGYLCLYFKEERNFPTSRADQVRILTELLTEWNRGRQYSILTRVRRYQLFAYLAYVFFIEDKYLFPRDDLAKKIDDYIVRIPQYDNMVLDGDTVLETIETQYGIVVKCTDQFYSFTHLIFQEYYTACYIADNNVLDHLSLLDVLTFAHKSRWHRIILLIASMFKVDDFFGVFLTSLDTRVKNNPKLKKFLDWIARKVANVNVSYTPVVMRAHYAWLAFILDRDLDRPTLDRYRIYALAPDPKLNLDLNLDHALACAYILARPIVSCLVNDPILDRILKEKELSSFSDESVINRLNHVLNYTLDNSHFACPLDRFLLLDSTHNFIDILGCDRASSPSLKCFDPIKYDPGHLNGRLYLLGCILGYALYCAEKLGDTTLYTALNAIAALPYVGASRAMWRDFVSQLQRIMIEHRDIVLDWDFTEKKEKVKEREEDKKKKERKRQEVYSDWDFIDAQVEILKDYFTAAKLLVECLDVAYVTDREAIENRLLLPPGGEESTDAPT